MTRIRRKRMHCNNKELHQRYKSKRRTKDLDQIQEDLKPENKQRLLSIPEDEDLPGLGQHYCVECSRYYIDDRSLGEHRRGREHKRRLRDLKDPAYTQREAEAAVGLVTDNGRTLSSAIAGPQSLLLLKQKNDAVAAAKAAGTEKAMDTDE
ncbi:hypothetical protein GGI04_000011 [Coemansia thaxteri]|uniref:C2H2-type domain-containing protein n=1 Tax=Coemansia thaxteri TaxID=2663907 RepID=A0A9W8EE15_9FUNG|nr:hypothetical protein H4R26_004416 [Coemansia thaxteri]KAJ2009912.1 hypothetical protein GGI04_000011 [Coemansia thaxteri]KAJ2474301.1 hypothetical protein GGI02_000194 [Coemansia sp. RSA 2322]KAJ2484196.1 hypothetical protein EV174_002635 [Coemansia sp. RSA 2320]